MIFVSLALASAFFVYLCYSAINPLAAQEFWERNIIGMRNPWVNTGTPYFVWTTRVWSICLALFVGYFLVALVSAIIHGQR